MSKYTPGPWSVEIDHAIGSAEFIRVYQDGEMFDIASLLCDETGNTQANAQLIAAAPDLLAALKMALEAPDNDRSWEDDAIAAIKKADPFWEDPLVN